MLPASTERDTHSIKMYTNVRSYVVTTDLWLVLVELLEVSKYMYTGHPKSDKLASLFMVTG